MCLQNHLVNHHGHVKQPLQQQAVSCVVGVSAEDVKQAEADQLHLLAEADDVWSKAQNQATESSAAAVLAVLASLQAAFASLRKLVAKPVDKYDDVQTSEVRMYAKMHIVLHCTSGFV